MYLPAGEIEVKVIEIYLKTVWSLAHAGKFLANLQKEINELN